jgi:hypothetical protein
LPLFLFLLLLREPLPVLLSPAAVAALDEDGGGGDGAMMTETAG